MKHHTGKQGQTRNTRNSDALLFATSVWVLKFPLLNHHNAEDAGDVTYGFYTPAYEQTSSKNVLLFAVILVPIALFASLSRGALARETKGSGDTGFPVLDSRTSGLHVCSRDVSKDSLGQSWRFLLPLKISFK